MKRVAALRVVVEGPVRDEAVVGAETVRESEI
jgi:hypothetical protein